MSKVIVIILLFSSSAWAATGQIELSLLHNSGNTDSSRFLVDADADQSFGKYKLSGEVKAVYGKTNDKVSDRRWFGSLQGDRNITKKLYGFLSGNAEQNKLQGIDLRYGLRSGLGYHAIDADKLDLDVEISGGYIDEARTALPDVSFTTAGLSSRLEYRFSEKTRFEQNFKGVLNIDDTARYLITNESALITNLFGSLALKVSLEVMFDSKPPEGFTKTDRRARTSLIYSF